MSLSAAADENRRGGNRDPYRVTVRCFTFYGCGTVPSSRNRRNHGTSVSEKSAGRQRAVSAEAAEDLKKYLSDHEGFGSTTASLTGFSYISDAINV